MKMRLPVYILKKCRYYPENSFPHLNCISENDIIIERHYGRNTIHEKQNELSLRIYTEGTSLRV